ncbi:MAG: hypothetical protein IJ085_04545 [Turicibacter sp.]|nr:hypothetical protein [Turicibacter sp.]
MRQAFSPPPPPPPSPFFDEDDIDDGLGQTQQNIPAEDRVPPECPQFLPFLLSLDPYTFVTLGYLIAIFIAMEAKLPEEQEAIGNFLEVIATNIEYISEQGDYLQTLDDRRQEKIEAIEKQELRDEIDELKRTISQLQDQILVCCPNIQTSLNNINELTENDLNE